MGIDDSVKLLAPVGERRTERRKGGERVVSGSGGVGSGGRPDRRGGDGGGEQGDGEDGSSDGAGDQSSGSSSAEEEEEEEGREEAGERERPALISSAQGSGGLGLGLEGGRNVQLLMRLAELGIPMSSRLFPAAAATAGEREPEVEMGGEEEEGEE